MKSLTEKYRHEDYIEQREGKACWSFRVKYKGHSKTFREDDYVNPKDAFKEAIKYRNQIVIDGVFIPKEIRIRDVLEESFDLLLVRKKTRLNHISMFNRYIKDNILISRFNEEFAYRILNAMVYDYSDDVISRVHSVLKRIDKVCLIKKYYKNSVMSSVICPRSNKIERKEYKQPITREELDRMKETFQAAKSEFDKKQLPLILDFFWETGCRPCEVWCLTWDDIKDGYISINKEVGSDNDNEKVIRSTKTDLSNRLLPITHKLEKCLHESEIVSQTIDNPLNLVFPTKAGQMYVTDIIGARLKKYGAKIGIRFNLYDIRHRFATDLTIAGVDERTRMELMGHSSLNMTISYARSNDETKRKALENR